MRTKCGRLITATTSILTPLRSEMRIDGTVRHLGPELCASPNDREFVRGALNSSEERPDRCCDRREWSASQGTGGGCVPILLVVLIPETRTFAAGTVTEIRAAADSLRNGALIGVGVGVGAGVAVIIAKCNNGLDCNYALKVGAGYAGIGAGIGAGVDALLNQGRQGSLSVASAAAQPDALTSCGKDRQGVLLSVRF